ncbi:MAG: rhomboid family intramembrane serine protease [Candidatus Thermoplasmatota archaeon]|nr:rhomboid family intramembrane serine protease [Candidatus Thermoplasmatota archaeon]MEC8707955.1 rhomboid family intramembrane serine protease [Candidatus Thermoplasmatota archaeon]
MPFAVSVFSPLELGVLVVWSLAIVSPIVYAARTRTSIAMGITVSVLLGAVVQVLWSMLYGWGAVEHWVWSDFVLVPARSFEPGFVHTLATAGFLHSQGDMMHVLGNVIILALVGVPLEQRLGSKRFAVVYAIGLLGGSLGWVAFNADSYRPALGASGAAFGLLGAYLAGWPKDEIPFPLLLIRPWPVVFIALLYFGLELARALATMESGVSSGIAHMAHIGGFVAAYALLPLVARGGPVELGVVDGGPTQGAAHAAQRRRMKATMVDLSTVDDPWTAMGLEVPKQLREPLKNLVQASDEPETRAAWMEHLADAGSCPVCQAPLGLVERSSGPHVQCSSNPSHLEWPPR